MDTGKPDTLSDSALDCELAKALQVEHSPEFLARVRQRIAREPAPALSGFRWQLAASAALVIAVVSLTISWMVGQQGGSGGDVIDQRPVAAPQVAVSPTLPQPGRVLDVTVRSRRRHPQPATGGATQHERSRVTREVLVSLDEVRGFELLLKRIGDADFGGPPAAEPLNQIDPIVASALALEPLVITPISANVRFEGELQ